MRRYAMGVAAIVLAASGGCGSTAATSGTASNGAHSPTALTDAARKLQWIATDDCQTQPLGTDDLVCDRFVAELRSAVATIRDGEVGDRAVHDDAQATLNAVDDLDRAGCDDPSAGSPLCASRLSNLRAALQRLVVRTRGLATG
jgi:hypothetical protein